MVTESENKTKSGYGLFGETTLIEHVSSICCVDTRVIGGKLRVSPGRGHTGITANCIKMLEPEWEFTGVRISEFGTLIAIFIPKVV